MTNTELTAKIRNLKELKIMLDELEAEIETAEDEIKAEMTARDVDTLAVDVFKVSWKSVTSNRFDSKAFKAAAPEIYNSYLKPTTARRFTIS